MPDSKQPLPRPIPKGTSPDYVRIPGQASAIYVPPSESRRTALPAPSTQNRGQSYYAPPGQAAPIYIPPSPSAGKRMAKNQVMSDERSKTEIKRLESTNEALTQALSGAYQGGNMPATEYPTMPQNTRVPVGHASFADTPVANTVAAQNVGLQQAGGMAPPPVVPANMRPMPIPQGRPATMPQFAPPDLSALDEAYRNIGRQQGGG